VKLSTITRVVYGLLGVIYLVIGIGALLAPAGGLPDKWAGDFLISEMRSDFVAHLLQEFGTVVLVVGCTFLLLARRKEVSIGIHWALTLYFLADAVIHWISPDGSMNSWSRGIINSIPFAIMLLLGVVHLRRRN
jgi:hypothetical protein